MWIKGGSGTIEFSKDDGTKWEDGNPYTENSWKDNTYINNMVLSGNQNGKNVYGNIIGYGLRLSGNLKEVEFINNGLIFGAESFGSLGIYNENGSIGSIKNNGAISSRYGIYNLSKDSGSGVIENLINSGTISGNNFGIYNSSTDSDSKSIIGSLINIGIISGTSESGICNSSFYSGSGSIESLINTGIISSGKSGIWNYSTDSGSSSNIGSLLNIGSISGDISGISNESLGSGIIENLQNAGVISSGISGISNESLGSSIIENLQNAGVISSGISGIWNYSTSSGSSSNIGSLLNIGSISGDISGISNESLGLGIIENLQNAGVISSGISGIWNYSTSSGSSSNIGSLQNVGVIYGEINAIHNSGGTINNAYNYGLLVSSSDFVVQNDRGTVDFIKSYGLAFKVDGDKYILEEKYSGKFGEIYGNTDVVIGYEKDEGKFNFNKPITDKYTIINAKAKTKDSDDNVIGTESLTLENGKLKYYDSDEASGGKDKEEIIDSTKKYILNGITDTLKVSGWYNELNNSIVNAYKTAVVMDNNSILTLDNTIVNGGLDGTSPVVSMTGNNNLILKNTTVNATKSSAISMTGTDSILSIEEKSIINGKIELAGANNIITIKESIINGDILATAGNNTLNLIGNRDEKRVVLYNNTMNIFNEISGFANLNIVNNVAFYENAKITNVGKINIQKDGILVLRIDSTVKDSSNGKIKGHALYENTGTIKSIDCGKLLLALNGAGKENIISFNTTTLGEGLNNDTIGTTSKLHTVDRISDNEIMISSILDLPDYLKYPQLNKIYHGILSVEDLIGNFNVDDDEKLSTFLGYLNDIYAGNPYSYSNELSRKSAGMFRDIVTDNIFKADAGKWMIYGGLTHVDGGTKDTYYGKGYYTYDIGSSDMDADTKITGAYMLGEYGISDTLTSGVVIGGNKLKSDLSNGSKVDGSALYLGAYAKKYIGNLKVTAGAGFQYGDYDADRIAVNKVASSTAEPVMQYSDNYNDMTYDIYLNGRYSHQVGENLFLEPYGTLSYTYIDQDGANEGSKALAIETDSKSFDYTVGKIGVDLKKVIPHEKGTSTLTAGVSYTKILDGAEEEYITGRFKGGSDFDILVAHKNEHSIGLNAKYALELENGVLFDIKGTYSVERDSHNGSGKNKTKGEWIAGAGMGYKF
ncbi:autotransporter outer membrane beta-barrel domain-containing protein [Fusobacterium ulcerans]|uniref:autotransporter outer membrane beta-barrel domain-containing protein n=1 Tax=Fusobacterium ulcerans TaxID=861 RepID=UPI001E50BFEF|nr:autotransporter outer membrane beta-barrel domain-containing protein [Fusobacterium ulcerans]